MKLRLSRSLQAFYFCLLLTVIAVTGTGVKLLWDDGFLNTRNITSSFEASLKLEELKAKNSVVEIRKLVENDRVKDSIKRLESFGNEVRRLDQIANVEEYRNLEREIEVTKSSTKGLLQSSNLSKVVLVLGNKISDFNNFVVQNRWRTLTRMSRRIQTKLSPGRVSTPGFFRYRSLNNLHRSISKDIETMISVTTNSVLTSLDKQQILTKIQTLNSEMKLIERYLEGLKSFSSAHVKLNSAYDKWLVVVEPEISLQKIRIEKNARNLTFGLLGLLGVLALGLLGGFIVYRRNKKQIYKDVEYYTRRVIEEMIIPVGASFDSRMSQDFKTELTRLREYIHKRMSFGTVFQEAVPFSSILLDSNLNMVWANNLFFNHWNFENKREENISWDYLQQFTNLGDDDPVLMALREGIAGIYQIQLKDRKTEEVSPFEMYVSPVEYAGQKRIMIFFYPLRSLEETISNQTKAIVSPIKKTLEALASNSYNNEFKNKIIKDFEIAGITNIFDGFQNHHDLVSQQKHGLLAEIDDLENKLYDQYKLLDDVEKVEGDRRKVVDQTIQNFKTTRDSIVHGTDLRFQMEELLDKSVQSAQAVLREESIVLDSAIKADRVINENAKAFATVSALRDDFKAIRSEIDDLKGRLSQSVEQSLIFMKREGGDVRLEQSLSRIKLEMKGVEKVFGEFSGLVRSMDVGLSKCEMIIQDSKVPNLQEFKAVMNEAKELIETISFKAGSLIRMGEKVDGQVVSSMHDLFTSFNTDREIAKTTEKLLLERKNDGGESVDGRIVREEVEIEFHVEPEFEKNLNNESNV
ncbi:MAG: hypothetical protein GY909_04290 [Oligoflexia bacterium]|nr:hypothetical protein [Oligoflexia bacterium]